MPTLTGSANEPCKPQWGSQEILKVTSGHAIVKLGNWVATGASVYSFKVKPGDLFILLSHHKTRWDFVQEAFQRGAAGALLTGPENYEEVTTVLPEIELGKCIFVENSHAALAKLGKYASMSNTSCLKIAITGSVGKTSTKEGLAQILSAITCNQNKTIYYNYLNENNELGVGMSLVSMPKAGSIDYGIFELGMSNSGEMRMLAHMVQPSIVIITMIGESLLEAFSCTEEIADAKCEIFETNLDAKRKLRNIVAVLNRDDKHYSRILNHATKNGITQIITFGEHPDSMVRLLRYEMDSQGSKVAIKCHEQLYDYYVGQPGKGWVWNSLAIIAVVSWLCQKGLQKAAQEFRNLKSVTGRGATYTVQVPRDACVEIAALAGITLIDDTYNASPTSMQCGLERLGLLNPQGSGRKIAVLGDMLGLGPKNEVQYHLNLKPLLESKSNQIDMVFVCGPLMNKLYEVLDERMHGGNAANDSTELIPKLMAAIRDGDVIYVKGSRRMQMELIVQAFVSELNSGEPH